LIFEPESQSKPVDSSSTTEQQGDPRNWGSTPTVTECEDEDSSPLLLADVPPLPLPSSSSLDLPLLQSAPHVNAPCAAMQFCGRGTVMIGKGTITFTAQRTLGTGEAKTGSLIVPTNDVDIVSVEQERVCVSVKHDNATTQLTFDATSADEAKRIATALDRDELSELQRKRTEASGRPVLIDHSPPRCFVVVYPSNQPKE